MRKIKNFLKASKGAELVEIILGVVIAIALLAVAIAFINNTIKNHDGVTGNDTTTSGIGPIQVGYVVDEPSATSNFEVVFE